MCRTGKSIFYFGVAFLKVATYVENDVVGSVFPPQGLIKMTGSLAVEDPASCQQKQTLK
jgi:hypothetical protein